MGVLCERGTQRTNLEENALHHELLTASRSTHIGGAHGLEIVGQAQLGDDDRGVRNGHRSKLLCQLGQAAKLLRRIIYKPFD